jgi:hypothetical protein
MSRRIRVRVKSTVGLCRPVEIEAEPTMTFREVKERVATDNVIDPESVAIEIGGRVLEDNQTLRDAGVIEREVREDRST